MPIDSTLPVMGRVAALPHTRDRIELEFEMVLPRHSGKLRVGSRGNFRQK